MNILLQIFEKDLIDKTKDSNEKDDFSLDFEFGEIPNKEVQSVKQQIKKIVRKNCLKGEGTIVETEGTKTTLLTFLFFPLDCDLRIDCL